MKKEAFIKLEDVSKQFGTPDNPVHALQDISLEVYEGEYVSVMGPSGSGKSTFFNMVGGLDTCSSGRVEIGGVDLSTLDDAEIAFFRCKHIGYIFQSYNLISSITALKNVALPSMLLGTSPSEAEERASSVLARVGLADRVTHKPHELSGGQQQRVAIARAIVNRPTIILADEPTANLDLTTGEEIINLLKELCKDLHVTVVTATHDHKMLKASDRIVWIIDGKIDKIKEAGNMNIEVGSIEEE